MGRYYFSVVILIRLGARPLVKDDNAVPDKSGKYDTKSFARKHVIERSPSGSLR
jgi:hypothetical protein